MIGIYKIVCLANSKVYIGSSINIQNRLDRHKYELKNNIHKNQYLQNVWNKYGELSFRFSVLEECSKEELLEKENLYIFNNNSLSSEYGFNLVVAQRSNDMECNSDYLQKLSLAKIGKTPKNFELCISKLKRPILEYENDIFIREYSSAKECGDILNISHKNINNFLRGFTKSVREYPNKKWIYKDGNPTRSIKKSQTPNHKKGKFKKVIQTDIDGNIINIYNSLNDTIKNLDLSKNTIIKYCNNPQLFCKKIKSYFKYG